MNLLEQRTQLIKSAQDIIDGAKERDITLREQESIDSAIAEVKALDVKITEAKKFDTSMKNFGALIPGRDGSKSYLQPFAKSSQDLVANMLTGSVGAKSLAPSGATVVDLISNSLDPIQEGQRPTSLIELLPMLQHTSPTFAYLRQKTRTNNAAPVAVGEVKPTSVYGVEKVPGELKVIAHLSEPVNKYWLEDNASLTQFVGSELLYGLQLALENQIINGNGTGQNLTGILNASGIQTVAAGDDPVVTLRTAITRLESVGQVASVFILASEDWEAIETSRITTGAFQINSGPVDLAQRKLWGVPVVTVAGLTKGTALALDTSALALDTDTQGVSVQWSEAVADDFSRNQLRARCEGRFDLSIYQPAGIAKVTLTK